MQLPVLINAFPVCCKWRPVAARRAERGVNHRLTRVPLGSVDPRRREREDPGGHQSSPRGHVGEGQPRYPGRESELNFLEKLKG